MPALARSDRKISKWFCRKHKHTFLLEVETIHVYRMLCPVCYVRVIAQAKERCARANDAEPIDTWIQQQADDYESARA